MKIDAARLSLSELSDIIKRSKGNLTIDNCLGERFLGAGKSDICLELYGTPGNALGAYLDGAHINVYGNVQDAVGDTMNAGKIIVYGNAGDALGYAMRGGIILIKGDVGYRAGVHMKEYQDKKPAIVIGGKTGSFLGEYLAGGVIIVLNLNDERLSYEFAGTGMHGGRIIIRTDVAPNPPMTRVQMAEGAVLAEIEEYVEQYCKAFGVSQNKIMQGKFYVITPSDTNPYKQHYILN